MHVLYISLYEKRLNLRSIQSQNMYAAQLIKKFLSNSHIMCCAVLQSFSLLMMHLGSVGALVCP